MKTLYRIAIILSFAAIWTGCQKEEEFETTNLPAVNISSSTLVPNANEGGTTRAYVGTEVTATGFNLDKVGLVTVDGIEAEIISQEIKTLVFAIPALPEAEYPQQDNPHTVRLTFYDADCETVIFNYPYYVTIPVTDAIINDFSPKSGTVGDIITLSGRNLDQITNVKFADATVAYSSFTEAGEDAVKFAVPAISATTASTDISIIAVWGSGKEIDVTATDNFVLNIPVFEAYTPSAAINLGDEITLNGTNLTLCDDFKWGNVSLIVVSVPEDGTFAQLKFPSSIEGASGSEETGALTAVYGEPAQTVTIAQSVTVNTAPVGAAKPVYTSIAPADASYSNLYLGNDAVITGQNLASVEKVIIDGAEVTSFTEITDTKITFTVPSAITGTVAKTVTLSAEYDGGNPVDFAQDVKVYPFYYKKGLRLGIGSGSKTSDIGLSNSFLLFNEMRTVSTDEFVTENVDPYFLSGENKVVTAANTVAADLETEYNSVQPYTYITYTSSSLRIHNPTNSNSQAKNFVYQGERLPQAFGTPMVRMRSENGDSDLTDAVKAGTLENIMQYTNLAGSNTSTYAASASSTSQWNVGTVIILQYIEYAGASSGTPAATNVLRQGYMVITRNTAVGSDGAVNSDRSGYVEFDLYWSNPLK